MDRKGSQSKVLHIVKTLFWHMSKENQEIKKIPLGFWMLSKILNSHLCSIIRQVSVSGQDFFVTFWRHVDKSLDRY
jgi:hypothetical protein